MSFTLYDEAVTDKIRKWVKDENATVLSPDETHRLFGIAADTTNDEPVKLPLITITRDRSASLTLTGKRPMSYAGKVYHSENGVSDHLNAIPLSISYTLNIYTRYFEEADAYVRNFAFNLINYPNLVVQVDPDDSEMIYRSFLTLQPEITDASDISERLIAGQFSRMIMGFRLNDAYLFSHNHRYIPKIVNTDITAVRPPVDSTGRKSAVEESFDIPLKHKEDVSDA